MISSESVKTWLVKHVVSPMDRVSFRLTGGRLRLTSGRPVLRLSTLGRRTGRVHATPVFYHRGDTNERHVFVLTPRSDTDASPTG